MAPLGLHIYSTTTPLAASCTPSFFSHSGRGCLRGFLLAATHEIERDKILITIHNYQVTMPPILLMYCQKKHVCQSSPLCHPNINNNNNNAQTFDIGLANIN